MNSTGELINEDLVGLLMIDKNKKINNHIQIKIKENLSGMAKTFINLENNYSLYRKSAIIKKEV